ncbi:MAG: aldo/keto reductase, partial [Planctomycetota bacterium]
AYGDSQRKIGRAIAGRREGLVLASKAYCTSKEELLCEVERSRRELDADVIDLYQLHSVSEPDQWETIRGPGGALEGVLEAREKGHVAHVGFTSHSLDLALELVEESAFETVQFPFNLVTSEPAEELIPRARELGRGFIVMKPLCGGQYDNAGFAFKYLNGFPDIVPIPGIEGEEEIEEIVALVESGQVLEGEEKEEAEKIVARLGKLFCRRCGYCQPCPEGVPVQQCMIFDSFVARFPPGKLASGAAKQVVEQAPLCIECGQCEEKCPYDLPIMDGVRKALEKARGIMQQQ